LGYPFPPKIGGQCWRNLGHRRNLIANISGLEQGINNRKTALQFANTPLHAT